MAGFGASAPSVNYLPPGKPPLELAGPAVPEVHRQANGGFVSFVLTSRHVEGAKLEAVVWRLWAFPKYISAPSRCAFPAPAFPRPRLVPRARSLVEAPRSSAVP